MSRTLRMLLALIAAVGLGFGWAAPAQAAGVESVAVQASLDRAGVLSVTQTFTSDGTVDNGTITQRLPTRTDRDGQRYTYDVTDIRVSVDGAAVTPTLDAQTDALVVSVAAGQTKEMVWSYTVTGATLATVNDRVDFTWQLIGQMSLNLPKITGTLQLPPGAVNYDCRTGVPGALGSCGTFTAGISPNWNMDFTEDALAKDEVLQVQVLFATGIIDVTGQPQAIWSLGRAFSAGWLQIGVMALVVAVGGLALFGVWRRGQGQRAKPVSVARLVTDEAGVCGFETDPAVRPGLVGTLIDGQVDPADILATILDLGVRGHLRITELPTAPHAAPDWTFTRLAGSDELKPYEALLLDALVGAGRVSGLLESVATVVGEVQEDVVDEVKALGWFTRRPEERGLGVTLGWIGLGLSVVVLAVLVIWTTYALVGLGLVGLAVVGLVVAVQMRPISPRGAAVFAGLGSLTEDLHTVPATGGQEVVARVLPYAVVLGGWDRWVAAIVATDDDEDADPTDLSWYHAPDDWHLADLPASLDAFITVVIGRLFTRA